jgi:hypothetical protein
MVMSRNPVRPLVVALALLTTVASFAWSASAEARGGHRGGWFVGGLFVGAALAPRYVYPSPAYYYPPAYYAPPPVVYAPPPVVYSQPPVVIQQAAPVYTTPAPVYSNPAPVTSQSMSVEERLRRLRSMCDQGLFTMQECDTRRAQILQEM